MAAGGLMPSGQHVRSAESLHDGRGLKSVERVPPDHGRRPRIRRPSSVRSHCTARGTDAETAAREPIESDRLITTRSELSIGAARKNVELGPYTGFLIR